MMDEYALEVGVVRPGLTVGSGEAASDRDVLAAAGVTTVINVAPMVCPNHFEDELEYWTLPLYDDPSQDITSILYDFVEYVGEVIAEGGVCYVHCAQGVSRSIALVTAYLMHTENLDYDSAAAIVRAVRPVADPNAGFVLQLMEWYDRTHWTPVPSETGPGLDRPVQPHLFRICPFDPSHDSGYVVARYIHLDDYWTALETQTGPMLPVPLDPRSIYILYWDVGYDTTGIPDGNRTLVWHGSKAPSQLGAHVSDVLLLLQRFEHAPQEYRVLTPSHTQAFASLLRHAKSGSKIKVVVGQVRALDEEYV